ncbi:MAG: MFS transporter [Litoreibacter sp.]|nr:MFS transporter [Litoreibacter sp.]
MEPSEKTNWVLIALLLLAGLFAAAQFGKLTLTLEPLQLHYPEGGFFVPVLVSIVGMVGIALGAVAGSVVAGIGLTRVVLAGLFAGGVISLAQTTLPSLPFFALLRIAEGVSHLAIVVAVPTLMASLSTDADRPFVMGIWAAFFGIAMAILALLLPTVLAQGGLALVFAGHGVGMILVGLVLWPLLPSMPRETSSKIRPVQEHRIIYSTPRLLIPGAGFVCYTIVYIALLGVLPLARVLSTWDIAALPIISIFGTILGGWVAKSLAPERLVGLGFLATIGVTAVALVLRDAVWPLFLLFLVMAFIPAGSFASIPHFNTQPKDRARATGGLAQLGNVGTTLGTPLFVFAQQQGGFTAICLLTITFCTMGLAVSRVIAKRIK